MERKSRLNLHAKSVAEVDPACVAAFNHFIDNTEDLVHVGLHMHASYDASLNRARDNEDGTGGPRLVLSFGDPGSADAVTNWTFLFPNLSGKAAKTRSLHYKKDGTADVNGGTREAVECATGDPRMKKEGVSRLREPARDMARRCARTVNSMSFGALFGDAVAGLSGLVDPADVADIRKAPTLAETASHRKAMMALVGGAGKAARLAEPDRSAAIGGIYAGLAGVLDGKAYGGLDPEDPLDRMMAWHVLDKRYDAVRMLRENGPGRGGLPGPAADQVEAAMRAADAAGHAPDPAGLAYKAMGLEALYGALDRADRAIGEAGGSAGSVDLGAFMDAEAVQGLLYLSAYKEVQDHGGAYGKAPGGNGRAESVSVLDAGKAPNVYRKLCQARAEQELRGRAYTEPPKGRCYPKTLSGGTGPERVRGVERHMSYRLFREAAIGEDPVMASGAPLGRVYIGEKEKGGAGPVLCDLEGCRPGLRLADVLAGKHGDALRGLPVLDILGQDGYGSNVVSEARMLIEKEGGSADVLALEMASFLSRRGAEGPLGRFEGRLRAAEEAFLEKQRGGALEAGVPTTYFFALKHSSGYPSMRYGTTCMGDGIVAEAASSVPVGSRSDLIAEYASRQAGSDAGSAARTFRTLDYGRQACVDAYGPPEGGWHAHLSEHSGFRRAQGSLLDACRAGGDPWAANDVLVLADCYGLWSEGDMEELGKDVLAGGSREGLYRPVSKSEADALRACYGYAHGRQVPLPSVAPELQGTAEGLAAALSPALEAEPGLRRKVADILEAASLDEGTLARDAYGDALRILEPPRKEVSEIRAAVDAAHLAAVLGGVPEEGPMAALRRVNAASDMAGPDGRGDGKTPVD